MKQDFLTANTQHCVDDIPPQLYAMSEFMNYSMFSFMDCSFTDESRAMTFPIPDYDSVPAYLKKARFIIVTFHLPLEAEAQHTVGVDGIKSALKIRYTGKG